jgi:ankyrin repeat protein
MDEIITFLSENTDNNEIKKQVIELLLANGANVNNTAPKKGQYITRTPALIHAVKNNLFDIYKILIERGADVNIQDSEGNTPLMYASDIEIVKDLINHGAIVNEKNNDGETALMLKYRSENIELIKCLIENGADVNVKDHIGVGQSLLLKAYRIKNIELVTYLIEQTDAELSEKELSTYFMPKEREIILSEMKTIKLNIENRYLEVIDGMIHNEYAEGDINNENLIGNIYDLHDKNYFSKVSDYLIRK